MAGPTGGRQSNSNSPSDSFVQEYLSAKFWVYEQPVSANVIASILTEYRIVMSAKLCTSRWPEDRAAGLNLSEVLDASRGAFEMVSADVKPRCSFADINI